MEIILRDDIPNLGRRGEIVHVKDGYARNYLLPKRLALKVTIGARKQIAVEHAANERKLARLRGEHQLLVERIEKLSFTVAAKASDTGKLYGSVGENEIVKLLASRDIHIERYQVLLEDHIKQVGVYYVPIRFQSDLAAQLKLWIVAEGEEKALGLPEDAPAPELFIGGSQSVEEAMAHAEASIASGGEEVEEIPQSEEVPAPVESTDEQ